MTEHKRKKKAEKKRKRDKKKRGWMNIIKYNSPKVKVVRIKRIAKEK